MSKSIGKVFGTGSTGTYDHENNYTSYLNNYNTANYDATLSNLTAEARDLSQNLSQFPDYNFEVEASDEARQRAENATFEAYLNKIIPQYQQQFSDLQTNLINQGIPVGSEAYQRAMGSLQSSQNTALNEAAYQSVLNGQKAYSQSLADSIDAAGFANAAQQNYIDQIQSLLKGSVSGYDNQANLYETQQGIASRRTSDTQSGMDNMFNLIKTSSKFTK